MKHKLYRRTAGAGHTCPEAKGNQLINKHTKTKHVSECRELAFKKTGETMKTFSLHRLATFRSFHQFPWFT